MTEPDVAASSLPPAPLVPTVLGLASGPGRKIAVIAALLLATIIPISLIADLIDEREARQKEVQGEFRQSWGREQAVRTPILVVPVTTSTASPLYLKIAPSRLTVSAQLAPEERRRGLFHATVYDARLEMAGRFDMPSASRLREVLGDNFDRLRWDHAALVVATSGLSGMKPRDRVMWDGNELAWQNCREVVANSEHCAPSGVVVAAPRLVAAADGGTTIPFQATLTVRGTEALRLAFTGRELEAALSAPWPSPSFTGTLLPTASTVTATDFTAEWQAVDHTAPRLWSGKVLVETDQAMTLGVELLEATPTYRMVSRAAKYGMLFVVLCFTAYFLFEMLAGVRIHVVQYGMLSLSLCLFPLLLLALSEPLGYTVGYVLTALPVLLQASLYTWGVVHQPRSAALFAALLTFLFGFLHVVLSQESYALLMGAVALFVVLSVVMVLTQRIDWSAADSPAQGSGDTALSPASPSF